MHPLLNNEVWMNGIPRERDEEVEGRQREGGGERNDEGRRSQERVKLESTRQHCS